MTTFCRETFAVQVLSSVNATTHDFRVSTNGLIEVPGGLGNVSISNVSTLTTTTAPRHLKIFDSAGTTFYIPVLLTIA